jgi:glucokinase
MLYRFLLHRRKTGAPDWFTGIDEHDQPAAVSLQALDKGDPLAVEALQRFIVYYAREAANLALKAKATGGLYIGGGVAPKILPALRRPVFVETFNAKGRMRPLLSKMPVRVILDETAALSGIARYAQHHAAT